MDIFLNRLIRFYLNNTLNLCPVNSTHYAVLYPKNDDRIVTIDYVTSLHPIYSPVTPVARLQCFVMFLSVFLFFRTALT